MLGLCLTPQPIIVFSYRAPRKIGATHLPPQKCQQMIPLRSRSDSLTFTPGPYAIGIESNFSRCPLVHLMSVLRREGVQVRRALGTDFSPTLIDAARKDARGYLPKDDQSK